MTVDTPNKMKKLISCASKHSKAHRSYQNELTSSKEGEGFEPSRHFTDLTVFKTVPFNRTWVTPKSPRNKNK